MSEGNRDTLESIGRHIAIALRPLTDAGRDSGTFYGLMRQLGWSANSLPPAWGNLASDVEQLSVFLESMEEEPSISDVFALFEKIRDIYTTVSTGNLTFPGIDAITFAEEIAERLFELLLVDYLAVTLPKLYSALCILGVIQIELNPATAARPAYLRKCFKFDEFPKIVSDPSQIIRRAYGWGTPELYFHRLINHLQELGLAIGLPIYLARVEDGLADAYQPSMSLDPSHIDWMLRVPFLATQLAGEEIEVGLALLHLPGKDSKLPGVILQPLIPSEIGQEYTIATGLKLRLTAVTDLASTLGIVIRPDEVSVRYPFQPGTTPPSAGIGVGLSYKPTIPRALLGKPKKSRLEVAGCELDLAVNFKNNELEFRFDVAPNSLAIVVAAADVGGFLSSLLEGEDLRIPIELGLGWSNRTGFSFIGGAGFSTSLHVHKELGPLKIQTINLEVGSDFGMAKPPSLHARGTMAFDAHLGPVKFNAEGLGMELAFVFEQGNAGPFDVQYSFLPPTSYGLEIKASAVTGGGYLKYDVPNKRYAGAVHLEINGIGLTALGLLTTVDGSGQPLPPPGFSFLLIITAKFPPIQLGYGFTLNEAGGLAGLHRTIAVDALQSGIREGSVDHILFPNDPINNAPQILNDLNSIFPVQANRYVFGPMAVIGWGTPTLIHIELGIIIELPAPIRIILLGQVHVELPKPEAAVVKLNVDILGIIDTGKQLISLDATLRDSTIVGFALTGDMAMRLKYGDQPDFALSVGGFNPHFQPPLGFPALRRVGLAITFGEVASLSLQSYLALTANSLQLGASAELYAAAFGFNIHGWTSFDVLVISPPFSFRADVSAGCSLRQGQTNIAAISVEATFTGPTPYHIWGKGSVSVLAITVSVPFDETFGERHQAEIPTKNPWDELQNALCDPRNWSGKLSDPVLAAVSLGNSSTVAPPALVHPSGTVEIRQRVLPLNKNLERFGDYSLEGANRYEVKSVTFGSASSAVSGNVTWTLTHDYLAPALSENLTDDQKLSRPSFELETVGIEAIPKGIAFGAHKRLDVEYETKVIDSAWESRPQAKYKLPREDQVALSSVSAKAFSAISKSGARGFGLAAGSDKGIKLDDESYVIASSEDLSERYEFGTFISYGAAHQALKAHLANIPGDTGKLQILPGTQIRLAI